MRILVTGAAGFIGSHVGQALLNRGDTVIGLDNLNDYYDVSLKKARLQRLEKSANFSFIQLDLADREKIPALFASEQFDAVVNLAAQAGVRYSLENPHAYIDSNIIGFTNILEGCRAQKVKHLVYASTSSVYGANSKQPFAESDSVNHPVALYAATKKANELMAHSYAHLYQLPCTGLRFFTVYGPWGRPDMALFKFTKNMLAGQPIDVYNHGKMERDFTYIDDIVAGIVAAIDHPAQANPNWHSEKPDPATSYAPWRIYNIGRGEKIALMDFIAALEKALDKKAILNLMPMQAGDVSSTSADTHKLQQELNYQPKTSVEAGINQFVAWYLDYYNIKVAP